MNALIGQTGFVGGNLARQMPFDAAFSSRDIGGIRGQRFGTIVCAGAYAAKWKANQDPQADRDSLEKLIAPLREVECERFVLISTVDVYERPVEVDESVAPDATHAYGRHRRELEEFAASRFPDCYVLRLPGLFGPGLKKNVLYDLLHDNQVERIHPDGVFQYYSLNHLGADIGRAVANGWRVLNVATGPIPTRELALRCFGRELSAYPAGTAPARYDFRTRYAPSGYLYDKAQVIRELSEFVAAERAL